MGEITEETGTASKTSDNVTSPNLSRQERRKSEAIKNKLIIILASFYSKVSKFQLSDDEIREVFSSHHKEWCNVCRLNKLNADAKSLFALEVKQTWEKKKSKEMTK